MRERMEGRPSKRSRKPRRTAKLIDILKPSGSVEGGRDAKGRDAVKTMSRE